MAIENAPRAYTRTARALHWSMAAIIFAVWTLGYVGSETLPGPDSAKGLLINSHKSVAIAVLALVIVRLTWRARHPTPPPSVRPSIQWAARAGHWLLYALMIAMPLSGWAWVSAAGRPLEFLGLFDMPPLLPSNEALKGPLGEIHRTLAWFTAFVILGHVAMALKHWLIDKDDVLQSMLRPPR